MSQTWKTGWVCVEEWPESIRHMKYLMRLKGWMTKTPLSSWRMHSCSTATSLPYTYNDCLFSWGRSRALHPQVATVHPTAGPFSFSIVPTSVPSDPLNAQVILSLFLLLLILLLRISGVWLVQSGPDLPSWSQGNFPWMLPTSGLFEAVWSEASGYPPFCSLPPCLSLSTSAPTSSLHFFSFSSQLINYSGSASHPHMNQAMSKA